IGMSCLLLTGIDGAVGFSGMRMYTPEFEFGLSVLKTTRITLFSIFPFVYQSKPMPPCVRMRPFSTVMLPGPTCSQPSRFLPLKSCSHFPSGAGRAALARARTKSPMVIRFRIGHLELAGRCLSAHGRQSESLTARPVAATKGPEFDRQGYGGCVLALVTSEAFPYTQ